MSVLLFLGLIWAGELVELLQISKYEPFIRPGMLDVRLYFSVLFSTGRAAKHIYVSFSS